MAHWTRRYAVPFFVSSLTAFVLAATALTVALVSGRRPPPAEEVDCVVGTWQAVSYWEADPALGLGRLELRGDGHVLEFGSDGAGSVDFGDGVTLEGSLFGIPIELEFSGRVEFRYTAEQGVMQFSEQRSEASVTIFGAPTDDVVKLESEPFSYQCEGDSLRQSLEGSFGGEFVRLS